MAAYMSVMNGQLLLFHFFHNVDTNGMFFGSALSPLSVNMVLLSVTGAASLVIVNVNTNGSVYTDGCYTGAERTGYRCITS